LITKPASSPSFKRPNIQESAESKAGKIYPLKREYKKFKKQ
jgi:hypothetical protein